MRRARRAAHLFFRLSDDLLPDIERLLRGEVELKQQTRLLAISVLTGRERAVSPDEHQVLQQLRSDRWTPVDDLPIEYAALEKLAHAGLVVGDDEDGPLAELRRLDERLSTDGWDSCGALYHSRSRWRDVDVGDRFEAAPPDSARLGPPPGAFHPPLRSIGTVELPLVRPECGLFPLLLDRKTTRSFSPEARLTREELAVLLYYTAGCQGFARVDGEVVLIKRTSPSGGGLHPVEVYPLVIGVEGVTPGLYHYRSDDHALALLRPLERADAVECIHEFAAGQSYLSSAQLLLILTARFPRSFWKYRAQSRAYSVVLMDAAHLAQTMYLVCAQLGLGAFVSAAVNAANIEDALGLDGFDEGVLTVCGCGRPAAERSPFDLEFQAYVPRATSID
jgi:putative peptide maturation dehydrogenase